jgi:hypothetical protein|tara:strand:+ start:781 stop:1011 length:231 start_codon:yes stop_codon:yes gene_type:complete
MPTEEAKKALKIIHLLEKNKETDLLKFFLKMVDTLEELSDPDYVPPSSGGDIPVRDDVEEGPYKVHTDSKGFQSLI